MHEGRREDGAGLPVGVGEEIPVDDGQQEDIPVRQVGQGEKERLQEEGDAFGCDPIQYREHDPAVEDLLVDRGDDDGADKGDKQREKGEGFLDRLGLLVLQIGSQPHGKEKAGDADDK